MEVLSAYLIQLVGTQDLEQLWKVLKFLDRYATDFCCCFNSKNENVVLIRGEIQAYRAYRAWLSVVGYTARVRDRMAERGMLGEVLVESTNRL